jgi:hypothetical protein
MGLDFSYILYFKREHLWDALQGVVDIAEHHHPPVSIHFPDHVLSIPLDTWSMKNQEIQHDAADFSFSTVLRFEEDDAIIDYLVSRDHAEKDDLRSPSDSGKEHRIAIGYIYLTIYQVIPDQPGSDLVLFDFGTTGTRMSLLFQGSTSIRKAFIGLLEKIPGVCGVFNEELHGELFWLKGQHLSEEIDDPYMMPEQIEAILGKPG